MRTITGLRPDIVPHEQWALRKWYSADPLWFYHRAGTDERIVPNTGFYELVDPRIRELCRLLNENGLHTTPSCQGHFYPPDRFELIWQRLGRQSEMIRGQGLAVTDSETQEQFRFHEPGYQLPWQSYDEFWAQAGEHQGFGYLGILLPCDCDGVMEMLRPMVGAEPTHQIGFDDQAGSELGGKLLSIRVRPQTPSQRNVLWEQITRRFESILAQVRCPTPFTPPRARPGDATGRNPHRVDDTSQRSSQHWSHSSRRQCR